MPGKSRSWLAAGLLAGLGLASAASAQTVALPLKAEDLGAGERYRTVVHPQKNPQQLGKDINGYRHVKDGKWSFMTTAYDNAKVKPTKQNVHYVIYNKPFYAMAAGVVINCWRRAPQNTPGSTHQWQKDGLLPGGGNQLWILHDDGSKALYAHAATDSIDPNICPNSKEKYDQPWDRKGPKPSDVAADKQVRVRKGQYLGRVGNSGASSGGPHLHVHLEKNGKPVALKLERGLYQEEVNGKVELNDKWQSMSGKNWPEKTIVLWPPRSVGTKLVWNGVPAKDYQRFFDHFANSGYMANTLACKQQGSKLTIDSTWIPAKGTWLGYYGLTTADYAVKRANALSKGFKETAKYTCNTGSGQRKCAVFRKP